MKTRLSSRTLFVLGFIILVLTNIIVFYGVIANRSGNPETLITLTERELKLPYRIHKENSGLGLRLVWRTLGKDENNTSHYSWGSPVWLSAEKLGELGFKTDDIPGSNDDGAHYKKPISKEVYIVLEYNGKPYGEVLKRAEKALEEKEKLLKLSEEDKSLQKNHETARKRLKRERMENSRLFAVDAGLDPGKLRETYKDRSRFIIAKGLVNPGYHRHRKTQDIFGTIPRLSIEKIHVPLNHRKIFDQVLTRKKSNLNTFQPPRYEVKLAYGSRLEPWIVSVQALDDHSGKK